jgi:hypothetical protein
MTLKSKVAGLNSKYGYDFLDALFVNPFFSSGDIKRRARIKNLQTVFTLIGKFKEAGIITDVTPTKLRNRIYCFRDLVAILER